MEFNLADLWEAVVDAVPEREAIVCPGSVPERSNSRRFNYAETDERANRLAHTLAEDGVGPGDNVGLWLYNGVEYLEGMIACFKLRAVPVNVNYRYVEDELRYLFDDADLAAVVHEPEFAEKLDAVRGDVPSLRAAIAAGDDYEKALASASDARDFGPRSNCTTTSAQRAKTRSAPRCVSASTERVRSSRSAGMPPMPASQSGSRLRRPNNMATASVASMCDGARSTNGRPRSM